MGSLREVLANLPSKGKALEMAVSCKKGLSYKYANYPCRNYPLTFARHKRRGALMVAIVLE